MNGALGPEAFSVVVRSLSPMLLVVWLALSVALALFPSRKSESGLTFRGRRAVEPALVAIMCVMAAVVWHQVTGEFIPIDQAWPSAIAMGLVFSLLFLATVNLQERTPIGLSLFVLIFFALPGSLFFVGVFFLLPWLIRAEFRLFGLMG